MITARRAKLLDARSVQLLHVEDDELCLLMLRRAFKAANLENPIAFAHDGIVALELLRGTNGRARLPRPFLILLDLKMPRMGGIEFLQQLRKDEDLKKSVVFILTSSGADDDKVKSYNLGVAGYILKTSRANAFSEATALLDAYCRVVELPARD
jgi:CheY-like chemotaxis protein